ncbi:MAG: fucose isomerase [Rikenellaceae bacterium]|nr:fucose isomerase [Rikenellaceae bacterium]
MAYKQRLTFGLIVATRNIFNKKLAEEARPVLLRKMEELGYDYVILESGQTPAGGAIETYADAKACAELFRANREKIDGIIVVLPNFGDEVGVINSINLAELNVPVLVQACDDENDKVDLKSRRDAFCGKLSVCNNLYQYGIPFTDTTLHTYPLDSELFERDVHRFAAVCRVVNGLRKARIGMIGIRPAGFQTVRFSEKLLQDSGITVIPMDMAEMIARAKAIDTGSVAVQAKIAELKSYGKIPSCVSEESVAKQAAFSLAVENWIAANDLDAASIQCWDALEKNYGCTSCVTMSMLGEKLIPCACEADIAGAVSMYALMLATGKSPALLDWNNNFAGDHNKCVCTHCSNYPKSFFQSELEIASLDVLGTVLGQTDTFGAVKGKVAPGPMTYFRISTDDRLGTIKAYTGEGTITDDAYGMAGGIAVTAIPNLQQLMKFMCKNGFEHHVAMVRGQAADIIEEALESYLGWELYRHE